MIAASIFAATQGAIAKYSNKMISTETLFFGRFLVGFILVGFWSAATVKPREAPRILEEKKVGLFVVRALCGGLATLFYYYGLKYTSLSVATVLFMTIPIFVPIVARIWLGVKIFHSLWWGLSVAFAGILCVIQPSPKFFTWGALLPLCSGILGAISTVAVRVLHYTSSSKKILFQYFFYCMLLGLVIFVIKAMVSPIVFSRTDYIYLLSLGVSGTCFQMFLIFAVRFAPARMITPFNYVAIIFTLGFDFFLWHKSPNIFQVIGIVGIILGAVLVVLLFPKKNPTVYVKSKK
ncbi:MAG: Pseudopaline exporter CntI [Chlamydiia bacterium]|nr:Pseudopaline exporter CntI [Chlamydiia bacterium]